MNVLAMIVAALIFIPLLAAGAAHLLWALGASWPIRDRLLLAQTVVGTPGVTRMPNRVLTLIVAIAILAAGLLALSLADQTSGGMSLTAAGAAFALIFIARGLIGFTPGWRSRFPTEPFAALDRKTYSPLILIIGIGFLTLVILRLT